MGEIKMRMHGRKKRRRRTKNEGRRHWWRPSRRHWRSDEWRVKWPHNGRVDWKLRHQLSVAIRWQQEWWSFSSQRPTRWVAAIACHNQEDGWWWRWFQFGNNGSDLSWKVCTHGSEKTSLRTGMQCHRAISWMTHSKPLSSILRAAREGEELLRKFG